MPYYKFEEDDIFYNRIKTHPKAEFQIYGSQTYYNNFPDIKGSVQTPDTVITSEITLPEGYDLVLEGGIINPSDITVSDGATLTIAPFGYDVVGVSNPVKHVPTGHVSLYEMNIDRGEVDNAIKLKLLGLDPWPKVNTVYPFITKEGSLSSFKTVSTSNFNTDFVYGDVMSASYPLSATITREYFTTTTRTHLSALKNVMNNYIPLSYHYAYSSASITTAKWSKDDQDTALISIPSIFYGSSIKKGSVHLKFYISGTLLGHLHDIKQNGELIQVAPTGSVNSGSVAGIVLYNEGFVALTGSWDLEEKTYNFIDNAASLKKPAWKYFGIGMNDGYTSTANPSSSFSINFQGTNYIPTITMLAHAKKGQLNHSNNYTYIKYGQATGSATGSSYFIENKHLILKNTVSSSHCDHTASFAKQTFISKIGLYDEEKNLIGIAKMATPVRKKEIDEYTFKLKLDF